MAPNWSGWQQKPIKDVFYDALWSLHYGALAMGEDGKKMAISVLKDALLFAERSGDTKIQKSFLEALR